MSTTGLDLSGDWAIMDTPESVTLGVRTQADAYSQQITVSNAICRAEDKGDQSYLGKASLTWHLWANQFATSYTPKVRDTIVRNADSTRWSVQSVKIVDMGTRFVCTCILERS